MGVTPLVNVSRNPNKKIRLSQNWVYSYLGFFPLLTAKRPKQSERGQKTADGYMKGVTAHNISPDIPTLCSLPAIDLAKKTNAILINLRHQKKRIDTQLFLNYTSITALFSGSPCIPNGCSVASTWAGEHTIHTHTHTHTHRRTRMETYSLHTADCICQINLHIITSLQCISLIKMTL